MGTDTRISLVNELISEFKNFFGKMIFRVRAQDYKHGRGRAKPVEISSSPHLQKAFMLQENIRLIARSQALPALLSSFFPRTNTRYKRVTAKKRKGVLKS